MTFLITINCEEEFSEILSEEIFENFECIGVISQYQKFKELEIIEDDKNLKLFVENPEGIEDFIEDFRETLIKRGFSPSVWEVKIEKVKEEDWSKEWKKHWKPSKISKNIVIKPSWEEYSPKEGEIVIELDPSNAFGTGEHPTTRLCVKFLEENLKEEDSVADIGCGSGILAICAAKFTKGKIVGVDNDESVIQTAVENARKNSVEADFSFGSSSKIKEEFDVVVANILHSVIAQIMPDLIRITKPDGLLIFSGILDEKKGIVFDKIEENALRVLEVKSLDKWIAILAKKVK